MSICVFRERFFAFCHHNRRRRMLELSGGSASTPGILENWQQAKHSLTRLYEEETTRALIAQVLTDPYFPLTMLRRLNVEEFAAEARFSDLTVEHLARIAADHLQEWAEMFLSIRGDLAQLNRHGRVSSMRLSGSPQEPLPEGGWCSNCGGCCQIRGGLPQFSDGFQAPAHWARYFRGDACTHQRFCPFLFEYFATAKFFCAIYRVKPKCCWIFGPEECEFLRNDMIREREGKPRES